MYTFSSNFPQTRMRRLRQSQRIRNLTKETNIQLEKFIYPLFIRHGKEKIAIKTMPGQFQFSLNTLKTELLELARLGIKNFILFGIPEQKDPIGSFASIENGVIQNAIKFIKDLLPDVLVITDLCFCEYTDHGHCGIITNKNDVVDNDATLHLLQEQALSLAKAGADIIAPSGKMDGVVLKLRQVLDSNLFHNLPILSYSVKYASALYGPFAQAAENRPQFGDRRTYQMDFSKAKEALRECQLDILEGTDMCMVKPAHTYLDILYTIKQKFPDIPLGAYHTSGEFAMIKAAANNGWINEQNAVIEILTAIFRSGADFIISYYTKDLAGWL